MVLAADPSEKFAVFDAEGRMSHRHVGTKRRFEALRQEGPAAQGSHHDSVLLVPGAQSYQYVGARDSLVKSELSRILSLERRRSYVNRVHQPIWLLCGSLPEVIHHAPKIAAILGEEARKAEFAHCFSLCGVLARDVGEALEGPAVRSLVSGLAASLGGGPDRSPEVARAAYSALSYVLRYCARPLLKADLRQAKWPTIRDHYHALLGAKSADARVLGSKALAPLLRRLPRKDLRNHVRRLLKLVAATAADETTATTTTTADGKAAAQRHADVADGVTRLIVEVCRGTGGRLHSRCESVLEEVYGCAAEERKVVEWAVKATDLALDATRPGPDLDPLWNAVVAHLDAHPDRALALRLMRAAVEYRNGRIFSPRSDDDETVPPAVAARRAATLGAVGLKAMRHATAATLPEAARLCLAVRRLKTARDATLLRSVDSELWLRALCQAAFAEAAAVDEQALVDVSKAMAGHHHDDDDDDDGAVPSPADAARAAATLLRAAAEARANLSPATRVAIAANATKLLLPVHGDHLDDASQQKKEKEKKDDALGDLVSEAVARDVLPFFDDNDDDEAADRSLALDCCARVAQASSERRLLPLREDLVEAIRMRAAAVASDEAFASSGRKKRVERAKAIGVLVALGDATAAARALEPLLNAASQRAALDSVPTVEAAALALAALQTHHHHHHHKGGKAVETLPRDSLFDPLTQRFATGSKPLRVAVLGLAKALYAPPLGPGDDDADFDDVSSVANFDAAADDDARVAWAVRLSARVEGLEISLASDREFGRLLGTVEQLTRRRTSSTSSTTTTGLPDRCCALFAEHALGLLKVRFEPLWARARKVLAALATSVPHILWPRLLSHLVAACAAGGSSADAAPSSLTGGRDEVEEDEDEEASACLDADQAHATAWEAAKACGIFEGRAEAKEAARAAVELLVWFVRHVLFESIDDVDRRDVEGAFSTTTRTITQGKKKPFCVVLPARAPRLTGSSAYRRLETMLAVFAEARFPRSLPRGDELRALYEALVVKPRGAVARLAVACLKPYGLAYFKPYAHRLDALMDDKTLRETLVKYRVTKEEEDDDDDAPDHRGVVLMMGGGEGNEDAWTLAEEHRGAFVPVLLRVLFGRFRAKVTGVAGRRKGAGISRRATILGFVAALEPEELTYFVYLMARPLDVADVAGLSALRTEDAARRAVAGTTPNRIAGFVGLARAVISRLGFKVEHHLAALVSVLLAVVDSDSDSDSSSSSAKKAPSSLSVSLSLTLSASSSRSATPALMKRERVAALKCLTELLDHFHASEALWACDRIEGRVTRILAGRLARIGDSDDLARSATASFVATVCTHAPLTDRLVAPNPRCVAALCDLATAKHTDSFNALSAWLLDETQRFVPLLAAHAAGVGRALAVAVKQKRHAARALQALRVVADLAQADQAWRFDPALASTLYSALVPRVLTCENLDLAPIQACVQALVDKNRLDRPASHIQTLVSLLAPPRKARAATAFFELPDCAERRRALAAAAAALLKHVAAAADDDAGANGGGGTAEKKQAFEKAAQVLDEFAATDPDSFDEADVERAINAYASLDGAVWLGLVRGTPDAAAPVVAFCAATMRCAADPTMRDAAAAALKRFTKIFHTRKKKKKNPTNDAEDTVVAAHGARVLEAALVPHVVGGLSFRDDATRRAHIGVLRTVVMSTALFADLAAALGDDADPNLDFFENVAHLQLHRRVKAFRQVTRRCLGGGGGGGGEGGGGGGVGGENAQKMIDGASAFRVLLPLAMQPLHDDRVHVHEALHRDAAACVGAVAARLPWSKYAALLKRLFALLKLADKKKKPPVRETKKGPRVVNIISKKAEAGFVLALCAVLDAFPFDIMDEGGEAVAVDTLSAAVTDWLLPAARCAMLKVVKNRKTGARDEVLRPPVALALLRLVSTKLRGLKKQHEVRALVVAVCAAMRDRDATNRDAARQALARMAKFLGPRAVREVLLVELKSALPSGYMLAVRSAATHSIVEALLETHPPPPVMKKTTTTRSDDDCNDPKIPNDDDDDGATPPCAPATAADPAVARAAAAKHRTDYDSLVADVAALLADDLFGDAAQARDSHAENMHAAGSAAGVPEAKKLVNRTYDSLELVAKTLLYRPSYAAAADESSPAEATASTHALLRPFFDQLAVVGACDDRKLALAAQRCRAALNRIALGFALNASAPAAEIVFHAVALLQTASAPAAPSSKNKMRPDGVSDSDSSDEEDELDADSEMDQLLAMDDEEEEEEDEDEDAPTAKKKNKKNKAVVADVMTWRPSNSAVSKDGWEALAAKKKAEMANVKVKTGVHAPRLTGRARQGSSADKAARSTGLACVADEARRFAIVMLRSALKKQRLDELAKPESPVRGVASPLLALLARSYRKVMRDDELRLGLVSVCSTLLSWRLPATEKWASRLANVALSSARRTATSITGSGGDVLQASFKMLAALLEHNNNHPAALATSKKHKHGGYVVTLSEAHLRAVAVTVKASLAEHASADPAQRSAALALFLALVRRTVVVAEMYDAMNLVAELHVVSLERHERKRCAAALLHFALHFPMGEKRRRHHLAQMLAGLDYRYDEGRTAALETLGHAFKVFAPGLLNDYAEPFFAALALRCANEEAPSCVALVLDALTTLLSRVDAQVFMSLLDRADSWLDESTALDDDLKTARLKLAAARLVTSFARGNGDLLARHFAKILPKVLALLNALLDGQTKGGGGGGGDDDDDDDDNDDDAPAAGASEAARLRASGADAALMAVEAVFDRAPRQAEAALARDDWGHHHVNIRALPRAVLAFAQQQALPQPRLRAARWFGSYFARRPNPAKTLRAHHPAQQQQQQHPPGGDAAESYEFLEDPGALALLAKASCAHLDAADGAFDEALAKQASKNLLYVVGAAASRAPDEEADLVDWTFDRLSSMACRRGDRRRRAAMTWFAAAATDGALGKATIKAQLHRVLAPVQRAQAAADYRSRDSTDTAALAQDLVQLLDDLLGDDVVAAAVAQITSVLHRKRREKKARAAADAIADPARAARLKLDRNKAKRASLKRKYEKHALNQGRGKKPLLLSPPPQKRRVSEGAIASSSQKK